MLPWRQETMDGQSMIDAGSEMHGEPEGVRVYGSVRNDFFLLDQIYINREKAEKKSEKMKIPSVREQKRQARKWKNTFQEG